MADTDILKEFLVAVGFKVDEAGMKRLNQSIAKVGKEAAALATAAAAAATAVQAAVVAMSSSFEDLYYAAQRIGDTADKVKGFGYAISQVGGSARGAQQALENVAEFIRSYPGGERFINGIGVATRDANGQFRGMTDVLDDLGQRFRQMPYYMAKVRAAQLGIDPNTLQAMIRGTDGFRQRYAAMAREIGVDQQRAAEASKQFMQSLRDLQARLELLGAKILLAFQGPAGQALERFANTGMRLLEGLGKIALRVAEAFEAVDKATGGWATAALILGAALAPIAAFLGPAVAGVTALGLAITALTDDFLTWREGGKSLIDWSQWADEIDNAVGGFGDLMAAGKALWDSLKPFMSWLEHVLVPFLGGAFKTTISSIALVLRGLADVITVITDLLQGKWSKAWEDAKKTVDNAKGGIRDVLGKGATWIANTARAALGQEHDTTSNPTGPSAQARERALAGQLAAGGETGLSGNAKALGAQAVAYFQSQGWTKEQAAGIAANLARESNFNSTAVGDNGAAFGLAQWHADRQAEFMRLFGHDIRNSTFMEQLKFVQYELTKGREQVAGAQLRKSRTAREAGAAVSRHYERPAARDAEADLRGRLAENWFARDLTNGPPKPTQVTIQQNTDVHVTGGDAKTTGMEVANQQERVNGNLIRQTKSAVS